VGPFTRQVQYSLSGLPRIRRYRRGVLLMAGVRLLRSLNMWLRCLDLAYPEKPADHAGHMTAPRAKRSEPGRMAGFLKTMTTSPAGAAAALPRIFARPWSSWAPRTPDWADPPAEAHGIVAAMPAGLGAAAMIQGAGTMFTHSAPTRSPRSRRASSGRVSSPSRVSRTGRPA